PAAKCKGCRKNGAALILPLHIPLADDPHTARVPCAKLLSYVAILPWVRVPHLASHLLGRVATRLSADWQRKYGYPIYLVEPFVERDRFRGTCYRADRWRRVGRTTGRSRNDKDGQLQVLAKEIYLQPLVADWCRRLLA
ncbi:MAG: DUF4338 domain-containing protein, partial [Verrucomicrobia bacterium]|nr:DUF4338 domain-containing protein [Verrucomicrobiota bacterium]